jgi:glutaredoxin
MSVTSIYNDYTKLSSYLKGQQFGPKDDIPPPNMAFPIIPQYHASYGIDTLSHGYNGVGYYTIETGYCEKNHKPTFNVASCPTNRPLQPFAPPGMSSSMSPSMPPSMTPSTRPGMPPSMTPGMSPSMQPGMPPSMQPGMPPSMTPGMPPAMKPGMPPAMKPGMPPSMTPGMPPSMKPGMSPSIENFEHPSPSLTDLQIHLFVQDGCKFCVHAKQFLKQNHIENQVMIHDLKDSYNLDLFKKFKGQAIPFFISLKTMKSFTGVPKSISDLISKLSVMTHSPSVMTHSPSSMSLPQMIQNLQLEMFFSTHCSYCKKLRSLLQQSNLLNFVKIYYENDQATHDIAKKYKIQGFPFILSRKTGKHITGAPPSIQQLISALS